MPTNQVGKTGSKKSAGAGSVTRSGGSTKKTSTTGAARVLDVERERKELTNQLLSRREVWKGSVKGLEFNLSTLLNLMDLAFDEAPAVELRAKLSKALTNFAAGHEQGFCAATLKYIWAQRKVQLFAEGYEATDIARVGAEIELLIAGHELAVQDSHSQLHFILNTVGAVAKEAVERRNLIKEGVAFVKASDNWTELQEALQTISRRHGDEIASAVQAQLGVMGLVGASSVAAFGSARTGVGKFFQGLSDGLGSLAERMGADSKRKS